MPGVLLNVYGQDVILPFKAERKDFDPDQPRDDDGKWSAEGSSGSDKVDLHFPEDREAIDGVLKDMIGGSSHAEVADSVGVPHDSKIKVGIVVYREATHIKISVKHDDFAAERVLTIQGGEKTCYNQSFYASKKKQGVGSSVFAKQVETLAKNGFKEIYCEASAYQREGGIKDNGYITWPKLGYNGRLDGNGKSDKRYLAATKEFPTCSHVGGILEEKGGVEWWTKNGWTFTATFDLAEDSTSREVLAKYLKKRAERKSASATKSLKTSTPSGTRSSGTMLTVMGNDVWLPFSSETKTLKPEDKKTITGDDVAKILADQYDNKAGKTTEQLRERVVSDTFILMDIPIDSVTAKAVGGKSQSVGPIIVDKDVNSPGVIILDGKHRHSEAKESGKKTIAAYVGDKAKSQIEKAKEFNPDEPRDDDGKWSAEGASGDKKPDTAKPGDTDKARSLAEGSVKSSSDLSGGMSIVKVVTMEDGTVGVFKPRRGEASGLRIDVPHGGYYMREAAAYNVALALGMDDLVPMTTIRDIGDDGIGSIQEFSKGVAALKEVSASFDGKEDLARAAAFDFLIGNSDRHEGNWLVKKRDESKPMTKENAKMVLIDNGLAFPVSNRGAAANWSILRQAEDVGLKVPKMPCKWRDVENAVLDTDIEEEAIALMRKRFDSLVEFEGNNFVSLPETFKWRGSEGY